MNPTVLVIALVIVGAVAGKLLMPPLSHGELHADLLRHLCVGCGPFCCSSDQSGGPFWSYTGLFVAVITGTFLIMTWLQPGNTSPRAS